MEKKTFLLCFVSGIVCQYVISTGTISNTSIYQPQSVIESIRYTRAVPPQLTACAPPNKNCAPPSEDCAPKKLTCSGLYWMWRSPVFGRKSCLNVWFRPENPLHFFFFLFPISAGNTAWISDFGWKIPCNCSEDLFFWRSPVFGRKNPLTFCTSPSDLVCLMQTGINFTCPLEFTQNKLLVSPQHLFLPSQSRYSGAGPGYRLS